MNEKTAGEAAQDIRSSGGKAASFALDVTKRELVGWVEPCETHRMSLLSQWVSLPPSLVELRRTRSLNPSYKLRTCVALEIP
jgi:hypothetical protein